MAGEHPSFSEAFLRAQVYDVLAKGHRRLINGLGRTIRQALTFGLTPELIHRVEFGRGRRQKPHLDIQGCRVVSAGCGGMGRASIFKQDDLPAAPLAPDHVQKCLMGGLVPGLGNEQAHRPSLNVQNTMDNPSGVIARNRNARLLPDMTIATVQRRGLRNNGFIQHEQDRPLASEKAMF